VTDTHAIVVGGSLTGLMATAALARHFDRVTLCERDALPETPDTRKGVPQARHVHVLLKQGERILADLFPGLVEELVATGATPIDMARDTRWFYFGAWKARFASGVEFLSQSRSFLEWRVRRRLAAIPGVALRPATDVRSLLLDGARRVRGVRLEDGTTLDAGLVVDATGRVSRATSWLAEAGLAPPRESRVKVAVGYASRLYRRAPGALADWKALFVYPRPPGTRLGVIVPVEADRWMVTLVGWFGDHPPDDEAGFLDFARSLPVPDVHAAIRDAEPLSPIVLHKFPANLRRHYEDLATMPDGLAVIGDALCSFNPIYGQGMTTGAIGARTLDAALAAHPGGARDLAGFSASFQRRLATLIDSPWLLTTCEDLRSPEAEGERPAWMPVLHWYTRRVQQLTWHDEFVGKRFLEVMHLTKSPRALFHPYIVWRALTASADAAAREDA
jgi:2-polyprenyl-6-methoxyphenol hydroxylase-like FAD-dependent oxidoreductase